MNPTTYCGKCFSKTHFVTNGAGDFGLLLGIAALTHDTTKIAVGKLPDFFLFGHTLNDISISLIRTIMVLSFGPHKQLDKEKQVVNIVWLNEQKIH